MLFTDFFADKIMTKIEDYTNNRIHQTIAHLQRVESYTKPIHKYKQVKINNKTKLDAFFGPIYFRGMLMQTYI